MFIIMGVGGGGRLGGGWRGFLVVGGGRGYLVVGGGGEVAEGYAPYLGVGYCMRGFPGA
jgi:hypothetical protein